MRKLEREKGRECVSSEYIAQECEREIKVCMSGRLAEGDTE